jgi:hypothetical protein
VNYNGAATPFSIKVNGDVTATSHLTYSDARLKQDVEEVSGALDMVSRMHPVYYNWNNGSEAINPGHKEIGFLAQEVESIIPNVVHTKADGEFSDLKGVAYDRLVALLVSAVKELKSEVDSLKRA